MPRQAIEPMPGARARSDSIVKLTKATPIDVIFAKLKEVVLRANHGGSVITVADHYDTNHNKLLMLSQFAGMLKSLGFNVNDVIVGRLFATFDIDDDGAVDYFEFIKTINYFDGDVSEAVARVRRESEILRRMMLKRQREQSDEESDEEEEAPQHAPESVVPLMLKGRQPAAKRARTTTFIDQKLLSPQPEKPKPRVVKEPVKEVKQPKPQVVEEPEEVFAEHGDFQRPELKGEPDQEGEPRISVEQSEKPGFWRSLSDRFFSPKKETKPKAGEETGEQAEEEEEQGQEEPPHFSFQEQSEPEPEEDQQPLQGEPGEVDVEESEKPVSNPFQQPDSEPEVESEPQAAPVQKAQDNPFTKPDPMPLRTEERQTPIGRKAKEQKAQREKLFTPSREPSEKEMLAMSPSVYDDLKAVFGKVVLPDYLSLLEIFELIKKTVAEAEHGGSVITVCNQFDANKDAFLEFEEFRMMLRALGFVLSEEMADRIFKVFDLDATGQIGYFEFIKTISYNAGHTEFLSPKKRRRESLMGEIRHAAKRRRRR